MTITKVPIVDKDNLPTTPERSVIQDHYSLSLSYITSGF